jgi:hypothetical protein
MTQQPMNANRDGALETVARKSLPAWLLSVVIHLLLGVSLALFIRPAPRAIPDEADRAVGIVLTRRDSAQTTTYFNDSAEETSDNQSQQPAAEPASLDGALPAAAAAAALQVPNIALPGLPDGPLVGSSDNNLVQVPSLTVNRRGPILPGLGDEEILADEAARQRSTGPTGPTARLSLFGSEFAEGRSFVFVIDRSKSMGGEGLGVLAAAERELNAALARLQPEHRFQIIAYNQKPLYFSAKGLVEASVENRNAMKTFFAGVGAYGGTEHEVALLAALRLEPDVIFLLTDGGDPLLTDGQLELLTRRTAGRTTIHCLQFGFGPPQDPNHFMRRLSARTRGAYGYVDMSLKRGADAKPGL